MLDVKLEGASLSAKKKAKSKHQKNYRKKNKHVTVGIESYNDLVLLSLKADLSVSEFLRCLIADFFENDKNHICNTGAELFNKAKTEGKEKQLKKMIQKRITFQLETTHEAKGFANKVQRFCRSQKISLQSLVNSLIGDRYFIVMLGENNVNGPNPTSNFYLYREAIDGLKVHELNKGLSTEQERARLLTLTNNYVANKTYYLKSGHSLVYSFYDNPPTIDEILRFPSQKIQHIAATGSYLASVPPHVNYPAPPLSIT